MKKDIRSLKGSSDIDPTKKNLPQPEPPQDTNEESMSPKNENGGVETASQHGPEEINTVVSQDSLSAIRQQLHRSTVPEFLLHLPTQLVEYYFSYVCRIFSSFDGMLNPFRSTVGRLWDGSAPIYYAIQSMAAAYLSNHVPRMSSVGIQMQRETYKYLSQAQHMGMEGNESLDKVLLTILLVGQTTAWHNPNDLGIVHLRAAKRLNKLRIKQQKKEIGSRERR